MKERQRRDAHWQAVDSLRDRISEYRPLVIVSLLYSIKHVVRVAADKEILAVPFPGNGQQPNFRREMAAILPGLPTT